MARDLDESKAEIARHPWRFRAIIFVGTLLIGAAFMWHVGLDAPWYSRIFVLVCFGLAGVLAWERALSQTPEEIESKQSLKRLVVVLGVALGGGGLAVALIPVVGAVVSLWILIGSVLASIIVGVSMLFRGGSNRLR